MIRFDFDNQRLGALIAHIRATKANPEISITFTVKKPAGVQDEILRNAAINARRKAEIFTEASGARLGERTWLAWTLNQMKLKRKILLPSRGQFYKHTQKSPFYRRLFI